MTNVTCCHALSFQVFDANKDQNSIAINTISPPILSRFLRIHPRTWVNMIAMRIEIFGCLAGDHCFTFCKGKN